MTITITIGAYILLGIILLWMCLAFFIPALDTPTLNVILHILMGIDGVLFLLGHGG